ncbi:haloacid dehalogenase-like hydrolase [Luteolibacter pohnpeiensis]|uniref:Haloacid dehalogenase-like hydrolase n=1 Tax=Luteolibacter pohnpeiensis TaxID=454153 RepID=A0A934VVS3_9BACT|nr:HAD family hydrolase [Luteolibacter pohnpeiensis]MBK1883867.1 haloacid dehalogenase-like hydrolase [Luteolibacter pohnpeiensis]
MHQRLPSTPPVGIALFDLDGTLIPWDCQLLFRHFVVRREPWRRIFLPVFLVFLPLTRLLGAGGMKRVFLSYLWRMSPECLEAYCREFAESVMPSIYPDLLQKLETHRSEGHLLILASASPEFYVKEIGALLGFDLTLATPVETAPSPRFFPDLDNHKGHAKVRKLHEVLPSSYFEDGQLIHCHGFTDSTADLPMLEWCETATVVNPSPTLARKAEAEGWEIVRPTRPWSSKADFLRRLVLLLFGIGEDPGGIANRSGWNQTSTSKKSRITSR